MTSVAGEIPGEVRHLVVDAANVVGSRPDGWWRDRAGATERLARRLDALGVARPDLRVTLVVEGQARGMDPSVSGAVEVVLADGSGDDAVVAVVTAGTEPGRVLVVTSDRGLVDRIEACGARAHGAGWLLALLDDGTPR